MVHSMFEHGWSIRKIQATVLNDIWPEVTMFTAIATSECPTSYVRPSR
jgi:hypothetical protein